jgi:hypothetical protein
MPFPTPHQNTSIFLSQHSVYVPLCVCVKEREVSNYNLFKCAWWNYDGYYGIHKIAASLLRQ